MTIAEPVSNALVVFSPEILVLATALVVIFVDLLVKNSAKLVNNIATIGLFGGLMAAMAVAGHTPLGNLHPYAAVVSSDALTAFLKALVCGLALLATAISLESFEEEQRHAGEYYTLILFSTLGGLVVVGAEEFLTFFVAFELMSIPLYTLVAFRRYSSASAEAGLKYFLTGAASSAILLFGISWIFGATGTTRFQFLTLRLNEANLSPFLVGVVMVLAALAFKISAAPFHMWSPDVYQGAPIPVAALLSTMPKAAMMGFAIRLFALNLEGNVAGVHFREDWIMLVTALSLLSILIGNLVAITQSNVKRLLAFSGVAQIGYILIGLAAGMGEKDASVALGSVLFYLVVYTVTNLMVWTIVLLVTRDSNSEEVRDFAGLAHRNPFLAFMLFLGLLSLAGVPPLAGFIGKIYLFRAALSVAPMLVVAGILGSVVSLYYYFGILRNVYFQGPVKEEPLELDTATRWFIGICSGALILGALWPATLRTCIDVVARSLSL